LTGSTYFQSLTTLSPFPDTPNGVRITSLDTNGDGRFEVAVGQLQPDGSVMVKLYGPSPNPIATYPAAVTTSAFALGAQDSNGDGVSELLIGTVPLPGVITAGNNQVNILAPLTGLKTGGFDAFAALVGNVSLGGL
jgi:hypothetical protein